MLGLGLGLGLPETQGSLYYDIRDIILPYLGLGLGLGLPESESWSVTVGYTYVRIGVGIRVTKVVIWVKASTDLGSSHNELLDKFRLRSARMEPRCAREIGAT